MRTLSAPTKAKSQAVVEDGPSARIPSYASEDEIAQYRDNFARARSRAKQRKGVGLKEKYVRERLAAYLRWTYDPRPFDEIEDDYRSIVASDLRHL